MTPGERVTVRGSDGTSRAGTVVGPEDEDGQVLVEFDDGSRLRMDARPAGHATKVWPPSNLETK